MPPQGPNIGLGVFVFRSPSDLRFVFGRRKGSLGSGKPPYPSLFLHHFTFSSTPTSSDWIAGTYSLTGGHLELGETFEAGAKREVLEETGLEIEGVRFFTAVENFFEGEGRHYVTLFMVGFVSSRHAEGGGGEVEAKVSYLFLSLWFLKGGSKGEVMC